jgi:hypothetical protein
LTTFPHSHTINPISTRQLNIADFTAHCADELSFIEKGATVVELMRDGKVIAFVCPAAQPKGDTGTLSDSMGTGAGFSLAPGCTLEDTAFAPEEWEDASDDS